MASTDPQTKSDEDSNRSNLQAIIAISISSCTPELSLSASDSSQPFEITLSARQTWSANPTEPLTMSTWRTPFNVTRPGLDYTGEGIGNYLSMISTTAPERYLTLGRSASHSAPRDPGYRRDWRARMGFITIPSLASKDIFSIKRVLSRKELTSHDGPKAGEEFKVALSENTFVAWWNWGNVEGDLKHKEFVSIPDPKLNGKERGEETPQPDSWLMSYGAWDVEDEEGREMIYLQIEYGKDERCVQFTE